MARKSAVSVAVKGTRENNLLSINGTKKQGRLPKMLTKRFVGLAVTAEIDIADNKLYICENKKGTQKVTKNDDCVLFSFNADDIKKYVGVDESRHFSARFDEKTKEVIVDLTNCIKEKYIGK